MLQCNDYDYQSQERERKRERGERERSAVDKYLEGVEVVLPWVDNDLDTLEEVQSLGVVVVTDFVGQGVGQALIPKHLLQANTQQVLTNTRNNYTVISQTILSLSVL